MGFLEGLGRTNTLQAVTRNISDLAMNIRQQNRADRQTAIQENVLKLEAEKQQRLNKLVPLEGLQGAFQTKSEREIVYNYAKGLGLINQSEAGESIRAEDAASVFQAMLSPELAPQLSKARAVETKGRWQQINQAKAELQAKLSESGKNPAEDKKFQALAQQEQQALEAYTNSLNLEEAMQKHTQTYHELLMSGKYDPDDLTRAWYQGGFDGLAPNDTPLSKEAKLRADLAAGRITREDFSSAMTKKPVAEVNVDIGEKSMTALGKKMSEKLVKMREDAEGSLKALESLQEARALIDGGMITGTGAEFLVNMGNLLSSRLGFQAMEDPVANTQAYAATMGNQVGQIIKQFGAGTGLSDADREYAEKIVGGKITLNEKALRRLLDINEKAYRNVIKEYNKLADQVMKRPGAESLPYDLRLNFDGTKNLSEMTDEELKKELGL